MVTNKQLNEMTPHNFFLMVSANHDLKLHIANNMQTYGGSFVKKLGELLILADANNVYKLAETFSDYFYQYATFGEQE